MLAVQKGQTASSRFLQETKEIERKESRSRHELTAKAQGTLLPIESY